MRDRHVSWEEILEALESTGLANSTVGSHVATCSRCARLVEEARAILGFLVDARLPVPPPALVERTLVRLRALSGPAVAADTPRPALGPLSLVERLKSAVQETWATLTADSRQPCRALRGDWMAAPRMLRYETPDYAVTLSIAPGTKRELRDVLGQLVPRRAPSVPADACATAVRGEEMLEASISATGEFRLTGVPASCEEVGILLGKDWIRMRLPGA